MRASGILLHPSSLPGPGPIGTLGRAAFGFVDWLAEAGQKIWQVLPLGPTGFGSSPYMSTSAMAGNALLIDAEWFTLRRWLLEVPQAPATNPAVVDFAAAMEWQRAVITAALAGFDARASDDERAQFAAFCASRSWLPDFALFTALAEKWPDRVWNAWPTELARRHSAALSEARRDHATAIRRIEFEQWVFSLQWDSLRRHAHARGVSILGDIPIFVSEHSADVWANPQLFDLTPEGNPRVVAGVPPDYFSPTGQRWGNPLYRWDRLAETGYAWWVERFRATFDVVDHVRIDHFRGFEAFWEIPADAENAIGGHWVKGPGRDVFDAVRAALGDRSIVAEDLGIITPEVDALRRGLGLPGMRVLQFAFDGDSGNVHLPQNYDEASVVYTGTHDNNTTVGWWLEADADLQDLVRRTLQTDALEIAWVLMGTAWNSRARWAIAPVQDVLSLGAAARMNTPGLAEGNWGWRLRTGWLNADVARRLAGMTVAAGRA